MLIVSNDHLTAMLYSYDHFLCLPFGRWYFYVHIFKSIWFYLHLCRFLYFLVIRAANVSNVHFLFASRHFRCIFIRFQCMSLSLQTIIKISSSDMPRIEWHITDNDNCHKLIRNSEKICLRKMLLHLFLNICFYIKLNKYLP